MIKNKKLLSKEESLRNNILLRLGQTVAGRSDCPQLLYLKIRDKIIREEILKQNDEH